MNNTVNWEDISKKYPIGYLVTGTVEYHAPFGIFLNIGHSSVKGLVQIVEFLDEGIMSDKLYPKIGEEVTGVILDYTDYNSQIRISLKPSKVSLAKGSIA